MKDAVKDIKDDIWEGEMEFRRLRLNYDKHLSHTIRAQFSVHVTPDSRRECISEVRKYLKKLEDCHDEIYQDEVVLKKLLR